MIIQVKYFDKNIPKLEKDKNGWIDLRVSDVEVIGLSNSISKRKRNNTTIYSYPPFIFFKVYLGVGLILPELFEAQITPNDTLFENTGLIQTNSPCTIDHSYGDQWSVPLFSLKEGSIRKHQKICRFKIVKNMSDDYLASLYFKENEKLFL
jgi:dUTPase